jgi:hypothetical protein
MIAQQIFLGARFTGALFLLICAVAYYFYGAELKTLFVIGAIIAFVGYFLEPRYEHRE